MTTAAKSDTPREARSFRIDELEPEHETFDADHSVSTRESPDETGRSLSAADLDRGIRWSTLLFSAMSGLAMLAAGLWFTRFVSVALERQDWIGWTATALMALIALALIAMLLRELIGFRRLARLSRLRKFVATAVASGNPKDERRAVAELVTHFRGRADVAWGVRRVSAHARDVLAPGELLRLADRELLRPLDSEARKVILASAKRVATITALSPLLSLAMIYVAAENVRMFRALSGLYGARPGLLGALRLARNVVGHIIATGGIAMTDDLLGQFVGQDVVRRLSRRLGEGAFNGALTARLGVVAVEVTRPLPFTGPERLRVREIFTELFRSLRGASEKPATPPR